MKKIIALLLVAMMALVAVSCAKGPDTEKGEGVLKYAEFNALADDLADSVAIEGYIQGKYFAEAYGNINLYLADADGGYYVYRMPCTADDDAKLKIGTKVRIKGIKTSWSGLNEFKEGTESYEILSGKYIAEAVDVTNEADLSKFVCQKVSFQNAEVVASRAADSEEDVAFLYNWDGSGDPGSDIYFNVKVGDNNFTFVVETDLANKDSAAYKAIEAAKIGEKLNLEGFLYWYNGAQLQITAVK